MLLDAQSLDGVVNEKNQMRSLAKWENKHH